ncbi:MAG: fumarylacetoacetate hydrolase family protein [Candidatus Polarisedimenticolaceae bacterium]|nr:fumarylacetoacetate hydrolase family protein [Candidatus Polarisedimenticolaceae bacterium]
MRITRFLDMSGAIKLGIERNDAQAEILQGELFGDLISTGTLVEIKKRLAPLHPVNIFCIGLNYQDHADETGKSIAKNPIIFMIPTSAVTGPEEAIKLPVCCTRGPEVDYEAELAVIIGKAARDVSEAEALDYVYGYCCANDVSARRWQKHGGGGQFTKGKGFDTFSPLGPVLVTADEIGDPQNLSVRCFVNGELRQDGNTRDMIFPVARLIHLMSQDTTLLPGTVILTGTPSGVGVARKPSQFLADGDQVTISIEHIGELTNPVINAIEQ